MVCVVCITVCVSLCVYYCDCVSNIHISVYPHTFNMYVNWTKAKAKYAAAEQARARGGDE